MSMVPRWETSYRVQDRTVIVTFPERRRVLSSAVYGGGLQYVHAILNHQVQDWSDPVNNQKIDRCGDPRRYLKDVAMRLDVDGAFVGLMTAVDLRRLVFARQEFQGVWVEGLFTVGVTNAVRAGEVVQEEHCFSQKHAAGTINMIVVTNACLTNSAMVSAIGVATESKTAVMCDLKVQSISGDRIATGTGTDVVVMVSGRGTPLFRYSGTHTKIGELIGRVVATGVQEGLKKAMNATCDEHRH